MAEAARQGGLGPPERESASPTGRELAAVRAFPAQIGPIDLTLTRGDIVHLSGGNGSGKTSLLRNLAGLDAPLRAAEVTVLGRDPRTLDARALAACVRTVWSSPRASLVGLTVAGEFRLRGLPLQPALLAWADRDVATLSSGEARRVALAAVDASSAPMLLLDEPCEALDPEGIASLGRLVRAAAKRGAVVVADHSGWAASIATRTVQLGPPAATVDLVLPRGEPGPTLLAAPAARVARGAKEIPLPRVEVGRGFHAVTGRNGAGKSTLLQRLSGLRDGADVRVRAEQASPGANVRLLQPEAGDLLMERTVRQELAGTVDPEGLVPPALLDRHPLSLSAGEAHRVALVKVLGRDVPVHLLDEPEAHADADARWRILAAVARRLAAGACVVAATHDATLIAAAHSRIEVGA
jgi:ABC-type transport system involved in cytochrome c biogenesis ATPase subunit